MSTGNNYTRRCWKSNDVYYAEIIYDIPEQDFAPKTIKVEFQNIDEKDLNEEVDKFVIQIGNRIW